MNRIYTYTIKTNMDTRYGRFNLLPAIIISYDRWAKFAEIRFGWGIYTFVIVAHKHPNTVKDMTGERVTIAAQGDLAYINKFYDRILQVQSATNAKVKMKETT